MRPTFYVYRIFSTDSYTGRTNTYLDGVATDPAKVLMAHRYYNRKTGEYMTMKIFEETEDFSKALESLYELEHDKDSIYSQLLKENATLSSELETEMKNQYATILTKEPVTSSTTEIEDLHLRIISEVDKKTTPGT